MKFKNNAEYIQRIMNHDLVSNKKFEILAKWHKSGLDPRSVIKFKDYLFDSDTIRYAFSSKFIYF